jgi:hypothetical protein
MLRGFGAISRFAFGMGCSLPPEQISTGLPRLVSWPSDRPAFYARFQSCRLRWRIIAECARRADTLIVTDVYFPELEGHPVCRLVPNPVNKTWDTWWQFSTDFFRQYFGVLSFPHISITRHKQFYEASGEAWPFFTAVGSKSELLGVSKIEEVSATFVSKVAEVKEESPCAVRTAASAGGAVKQLTKTFVNGVLGPFNLEIRRRQ